MSSLYTVIMPDDHGLVFGQTKQRTEYVVDAMLDIKCQVFRTNAS